ncbi:MAG: PAS domain-containing sensor histidine kinase, partial [Bacteroidetes bacterium]|nr:PAS domain-containing sensor histidine kinase [Bacteroidota bacterium]
MEKNNNSGKCKDHKESFGVFSRNSDSPHDNYSLKQIVNEIHDSLPVMVHSIDNNGALINVNNRWLKGLGYERSEVIGKKSIDFLTKESREYAEKIVLPDFFNKGYCSDIYLQMVRKDGGVLDVLLSATSLRNERKEVISSVAVINDITEQIRAKNALKESEEKYRLILENTSEFFVSLETDRTISFLSASYCEKFGLNEQEHIGKEFMPFINVDDRQKALVKMENLMYPPHSEYIEHRANTREGERWLAWSFKAVIDDNNKVSSFIGVGRDVTRQKEAEYALKESERRYRTIAESAITGITRADKDDNITYVNKAFCKMLGYNEEELSGMNLGVLIHADDHEQYKTETNERKNGIYSVYETRLLRHDGSPLYVLVSASPFLDSDGLLIETMAIIVDISKLKETEDKLKEADKLKSAFLANMSHEIRNPMNGIIGFADLLRFPDLSEDQKNEYIDLITDSCNVLLNLIEDIIDISKIEAGQLIIKESPTYLNELLYQLYKQFYEKKSKDEKEHIELILKIGIEKKDLKITTDGFRLRQILANLLENALKFTKKGKIEFGYTLQQEEQLQFFVKDTGIGMPPDKLNIIFDRFRQVDEDPAIRRFGGAGLGLSISKSLAELLGGKMYVESDLDRGSAFYFTLPYKMDMSRSERCTEETESDEGYKW